MKLNFVVRYNFLYNNRRHCKKKVDQTECSTKKVYLVVTISDLEFDVLINAEGSYRDFWPPMRLRYQYRLHVRRGLPVAYVLVLNFLVRTTNDIKSGLSYRFPFRVPSGLPFGVPVGLCLS